MVTGQAGIETAVQAGVDGTGDAAIRQVSRLAVSHIAVVSQDRRTARAKGLEAMVGELGIPYHGGGIGLERSV
jgi:hypothetical protein